MIDICMKIGLSFLVFISSILRMYIRMYVRTELIARPYLLYNTVISRDIMKI